MNVIGLNIAGWNVVKFRDKMEDYFATGRPSWITCFGTDVGRTAWKLSGGATQVGVRIYDNEKAATTMNVDQLMQRFDNVAAEKFFCIPWNESGLHIDKMLEVLPTMLRKGFKMAVPVPSSGTPEPPDWRGARPIMELAAEFPDSLWIAVNEYIPFVPWNKKAKEFSPDMPFPTIDPWKPGQRYDNIQANWYNGRLENFLYPWCDLWGLPHPSYVVTELGIARENGAVNAPSFNKPYPGPNGWWSIRTWLESQYPGQSAAEIYAGFIVHLAKFYSRPGSTCKGTAFYCVGADYDRTPGGDQSWDDFDAERDIDPFYRIWKAYAAGLTPVPPKDTRMWAQTRIGPNEDYANIRTAPSTGKTPIATVLRQPALVEIDAGNFIPGNVPVYGDGFWIPLRFSADSPVSYAFSGVIKFLPVT